MHPTSLKKMKAFVEGYLRRYKNNAEASHTGAFCHGIIKIRGGLVC